MAQASIWPNTALAIAKLGAAGFSVALFAQTLSLKPEARDAFLTRNELGAVPRHLLLVSLGCAAVAPLLAIALMWVFTRRASAARLASQADIAAPLAVIFTLPALFLWPFGQHQPVVYLLILSLFIFAARSLLEASFTELQKTGATFRARPLGQRLGAAGRAVQAWAPSWWAAAIVVVASCAYAAYMGYFSVLRHRLIQTAAFDLGIFDNLLYNTIHGRWFRSPVMFGSADRSFIASHAVYAMLLFAPLYALYPHAETLLWLQAVALGAAAIPLYAFARQFLNRPAALLVALAYLLFAPLHGPNFYDFHWLPISIFFLFLLFFALARCKLWLAAPTLLVLFAVREDVALGLVMLGVFLFLTGARVRFGLLLAGVASAWFVVNKFVIMTRAGSWWFENLYSELFADGKAGYAGVVATLVSNPVYALTSFVRENKLAYGLHMVAPLAFLPLRKPAFLLLLLPACVFTLMTTGYWPTVSIAFQYTAHWIPYVFLTAVLGLWLFQREPGGVAKGRAALVVMVVATLSHSYNFGAVLQRESVVGGFSPVAFRMSASDRARYQALSAALKQIPQTASVATTEYLTPHVSARLDAYVLSRTDIGAVDYILFSNRDLSDDVRRKLTEKLGKGQYGLAALTGNEFYLFKRGLSSSATAGVLRQLGL